jgi:hypothetical protein
LTMLISAAIIWVGLSCLMEVEEFTETLNRLLPRDGFRPFHVELVDGQVFEFIRPHSVSHREGSATGFANGRKLVTFEASEVKRFIQEPIGNEPMMTSDEFYRLMIEKLDRRPFQPFSVEFLDGRRVEIDVPNSTVIRGGVAGFLGPRGRYVRIENNEVRQISDCPTNAISKEWAFMTEERFDAIISVLLSRIPFEVFTIELKNGKQFEIDHSRALRVRDGFIAFSSPGSVLIIFDHESVSHIIDAPRETPLE